MATAKIDSNQNPNNKIEQLLKEIAKLNLTDLKNFKSRFDQLFQQKKPNYTKKERQLIDKIKNGGPDQQIIKRHKQLLKKSVRGEMTAKENQEALQLIPILDKWTLERTKAMLELAKIWNTDLDTIIEKLAIKPAETIYG